MGGLKYTSTSEIPIPKDPFERIIGQPEAVAIAKLIPAQRRHMLLVGAPGTGKSMIAQAIASVLPKPKYEIAVLNNDQQPERPFVEIKHKSKIYEEKIKDDSVGLRIHPMQAPPFVAEKLGFRCKRCGILSHLAETVCSSCGADKAKEIESEQVHASRLTPAGKLESLLYERAEDGTIKMLTKEEVQKLNEQTKEESKRIIVPINRSLFVQASGGSETELLGDVRHDPYGSHPQLGSPPFMRVVPGAIHEAHEGVLFVDELSTLGEIQRYILTAMQDKVFSIVGRNPTSSGASVKVDSVPCDFIFVGATNINDLGKMVPALRSRIRGDGYEVLMNSFMPETLENKKKLLQFIAQEIKKDSKIPHACAKATEEILQESIRITKKVDGVSGYSLRLRNLSGILKMAGDLAILNKHELIEKQDVISALKSSRSIEDQLKEKYDTPWKVGHADNGVNSVKPGPETA